MRQLAILFTLPLIAILASAQPVNPQSGEPFPVRGLCIEAPYPSGLKNFIHFMDEELVPRKVNTLILRIDFKYQFKSHPELR